MLAVQNTWSQNEVPVSKDSDDGEDEEEIESDEEGDKQRGGVQPALKDRREAQSRELGISGADTGSGGEGRGGPGLAKKSRGTAALILADPIADFIKGRLRPGTTKITHERVAPIAMPGDPAKPAETAKRSGEESPQKQYHVPGEFLQLVYAYLTTVHSADQKSVKAGGSEGSPNTPN